MWTRKNLKDKAKRTFKANYWKTVLVAMVLAALVGSLSYVGGSAAGAGVGAGSSGRIVQESADYESLNVDGYSQQELDALVGETDGLGQEYIDTYGDLNEYDNIDEYPPMVNEMLEDGTESASRDNVAAIGVAMLALLGLFFLVVVLVALAIDALLVNPLVVGGARFMLLNLNQKAKVRELGYAFDHNYRETVKTMFLRDIFILLWSMLFVIPGIVKSYEYRMIPYLLAEDPAMTKDRAFAESKRMMTGNKWRAFVLDLSFLGWQILSAMTLCILGIFYVEPYQEMTNAALYEELRYGTEASEGNAAIEAASDVPVPPFAQVDAPQSMWDDGAESPASEPEAVNGAEASDEDADGVAPEL